VAVPALDPKGDLMLVGFENDVTASVKASEARHRDSESKNIDQRHFGHVQRQV
jgi:hypothetical protein